MTSIDNHSKIEIINSPDTKLSNVANINVQKSFDNPKLEKEVEKKGSILSQPEELPPHLRIKENLKTYFEGPDIKELCYDLNIDFEDLSGVTKGEKIISLITYVEKYGKLNELVTYCKKLRPNVEW